MLNFHGYLNETPARKRNRRREKREREKRWGWEDKPIRFGVTSQRKFLKNKSPSEIVHLLGESILWHFLLGDLWAPPAFDGATCKHQKMNWKLYLFSFHVCCFRSFYKKDKIIAQHISHCLCNTSNILSTQIYAPYTLTRKATHLVKSAIIFSTCKS